MADTVQVLISGLKTQEALNAALFTMVQDQNTENLSLKRDIKAANRREVNQKTIKNIAIGGGATLSAFFGLLYLLK